jgi:hypothetical protein
LIEHSSSRLPSSFWHGRNKYFAEVPKLYTSMGSRLHNNDNDNDNNNDNNNNKDNER